MLKALLHPVPKSDEHPKSMNKYTVNKPAINLHEIRTVVFRHTLLKINFRLRKTC